MKAQQIFDKVVKHLRKQGKQATDGSGGGCLYRTENGLMCAAGCLIKKSEYVPDMEYKTIESLISENGAHRGLTPDDMYARLHPFVNLIKQLQDAHDSYKKPSQWEPAFKRIAKTYHLEYTAPPKNDKR